jgi:hypothetical protein
MDTIFDISDRTGWPAGPWDGEPDRATWVHDETGARCTLRRGPLGSWCGYVGLRPNHPAAGKRYQDLDIRGEELTYGHYCEAINEDEWIRYRMARESWVTESLIFPHGDAARHLREDRKGNTSTLNGYRKWMQHWVLCHDDCPHGLWWLGFDTAHLFDVIPGMLMHLHGRMVDLYPMGRRPTYKTLDWMVTETNRLATELFSEEFISSMEGKA